MYAIRSYYELSHTTQQNAAASEELASSAEELASQAEILKDSIQFFKIEKTNHANHKFHF